MSISDNGSMPQIPKTQEEQELEYLASPEATDDQVTLVARNQRIMRLIDELDMAARQVVRLQDQLGRRDLEIKFLKRNVDRLTNMYEPQGATMTTPEEPAPDAEPTEAPAPEDTPPTEAPAPYEPEEQPA